MKEQRDYKKLALGEELSKYRFKQPKDIVEILKYNRTCMTLWHFETVNQREADLVKGMALMLNVLLDAHEAALKLDKVEDVDKRLLYWKKYKTNIEKPNIWNNIIKAGRSSGDK